MKQIYLALSVALLFSMTSASVAETLTCSGVDPLYGQLDITFNTTAKTVVVRGTTFKFSKPEDDLSNFNLVSEPFNAKNATQDMGSIMLGLTFNGEVPDRVNVSYIDEASHNVKNSADYDCKQASS